MSSGRSRAPRSAGEDDRGPGAPAPSGEPAIRRLPRHIGLIPDGNRRWADARGLPRAAGYRAGLEPGFRTLSLCRELGIEEVSIYGFTTENARRPADQVAAFRAACEAFGLAAVRAGVALLAVGNTRSPAFPDALRPFARARSAGDIRANLLVNYGWRWDVRSALAPRRRVEGSGTAERRAREQGGARGPSSPPPRRPPLALGSAAVSRIDLVVRWGGRRRLSGFLPLQSAYADIHIIDTLWPDMQPSDLRAALAWYQGQDVTLGG